MITANQSASSVANNNGRKLRKRRKQQQQKQQRRIENKKNRRQVISAETATNEALKVAGSATVKSNNTAMTTTLYFPPPVLQTKKGGHTDNNTTGDDDVAIETDVSTIISEAFFELANADRIGYRVMSSSSVDSLYFQQDSNACGKHTGGIIWETSYLLLQYLLYHNDNGSNRSAVQLASTQGKKDDCSDSYDSTSESSTSLNTPTIVHLGRVLELGAGVGFLGQCLAAESNSCATNVTTTNSRKKKKQQSKKKIEDTTSTSNLLSITSIVLTETDEVLVNLLSNLRQNSHALQSYQEHSTSSSDVASPSLSKRPDSNYCDVSAYALDWTKYESDCMKTLSSLENEKSSPRNDDIATLSSISEKSVVLQPESFDTILGTDIIFTPELVVPLLQTAAFLCHSNTVWYLCVQIRCKTSHELFLASASSYGFRITPIQYKSIKQCEWGQTQDCLLYCITRISKNMK